MRYSVTRGFTIAGREDRLQGNANNTLSSSLVGESAVLKSLTRVMIDCMYVCMNVCMYVCMYVCSKVHIFASPKDLC